MLGLVDLLLAPAVLFLFFFSAIVCMVLQEILDPKETTEEMRSSVESVGICCPAVICSLG